MENRARVFIRVRPRVSLEEDTFYSIKIDSRRSISLSLSDECMSHAEDERHVSVAFEFDGVLSEEASQIDVFEQTGKEVSEKALTGMNATILAYGPTASGKTYTMVGKPGEASCEDGLCLRVIKNVFEQASSSENASKRVLVSASFLEVYNEKVYDLTNRNVALSVSESPDKGVVVEGANEVALSAYEHAKKLIRRAFRLRHSDSNNVNSRSSRSHLVIFFHICIEEDKHMYLRRNYSRLTLVDLAGSERGKVTGFNNNYGLNEANHINKSLLNLGKVITSLAESSNHVPYRSSKLTFLLKDSLSRNSFISIIGHISPSKDNFEESLSTLRFVSFARTVKLRAVPNICENSHLCSKCEKFLIENNFLLKNGGSAVHSDNASISDNISVESSHECLFVVSDYDYLMHNHTQQQLSWTDRSGSKTSSENDHVLKDEDPEKHAEASVEEFSQVDARFNHLNSMLYTMEDRLFSVESKLRVQNPSKPSMSLRSEDWEFDLIRSERKSSFLSLKGSRSSSSQTSLERPFVRLPLQSPLLLTSPRGCAGRPWMSQTPREEGRQLPCKDPDLMTEDSDLEMSNKVDLPLVCTSSAALSTSESSSISDGDRVSVGENKQCPEEPKLVSDEPNRFRRSSGRNLFKPDLSKLLSSWDHSLLKETSDTCKTADVEADDKNLVKCKQSDDGCDDTNDSIDSVQGSSLTSQQTEVNKSIAEAAPVHEGILLKRARRLLGVLQLRKCSINHDSFVYTRTADDDAVTEVHLKLCSILAIESSGTNILVDNLGWEKMKTREFSIWTSRRSYSFVCETLQDCYSWLLSFRLAMSVHQERCAACSSKRSSASGKQGDAWYCTV